LFPFTLKFYSNDRDAGTISSSLFKAYQWTCVGPFAAGGLDKVYPPEKGVNLLQSYDAAGGKLQWRVVPDIASGSSGEIALRGLPGNPASTTCRSSRAYETDVQALLSTIAALRERPARSLAGAAATR
jgi:hypothetical protein